MTIDEAIKHAEETALNNLNKTRGRNAGDPFAINCFNCAEEHRQLAEWLKELEELKNKQRWIPVSERLPEEYGEVLITWTTSQSKREFIGIAEYGFKGEWLLEDYIKNYRDVEVIAWMPLPPVFKAESEEE